MGICEVTTQELWLWIYTRNVKEKSQHLTGLWKYMGYIALIWQCCDAIALYLYVNDKHILVLCFLFHSIPIKTQCTILPYVTYSNYFIPQRPALPCQCQYNILLLRNLLIGQLLLQAQSYIVDCISLYYRKCPTKYLHYYFWVSPEEANINGRGSLETKIISKHAIWCVTSWYDYHGIIFYSLCYYYYCLNFNLQIDKRWRVVSLRY